MSSILDYRQVICIKGCDSKLFLQNILTNDISKLEKNGIQYSLMLTPQGKILYDFFIFRDEESFYLDCHTSYLTDIRNRLSVYKLDCDLEITDSHFTVHVSSTKLGRYSYLDPRNKNLGYRIYTTIGIDHHSLVQYEEMRIKHVVPEMGIDFFSEQFFSLDLNMKELNAINFNKGCFIGQEVTARMHHKKIRKKTLQIVPIDKYQIDNNQLKEGNKSIGKILKIYKNSAFVMINKIVS